MCSLMPRDIIGSQVGRLEGCDRLAEDECLPSDGSRARYLDCAPMEAREVVPSLSWIGKQTTWRKASEETATAPLLFFRGRGFSDIRRWYEVFGRDVRSGDCQSRAQSSRTLNSSMGGRLVRDGRVRNRWFSLVVAGIWRI